MNLLAFAASHRTDSLNRQLLGHAVPLLEKSGTNVTVLDYASLDMPTYNDALAEKSICAPALALAEKIKSADGIVIATPEYNWSMPGSLKTIIDWLSRIDPNPLKHKTAFLMCASTSPRGGLMGLAHLKLSLEALDVHVYPKMFALGHAPKSLQSADALQNLGPMLANYVKFTKSLGA